MASFPSPPRATGDPAVDLPAIIEYEGALYRVLVLEGLVAGNAPAVTENDLPDPASTSLATAQQTANQAFTLAVQARAEVRASYPVSGDITISGAATTGAFTFPEEQPDTDYFVQATCTDFTGSPTLSATVVTRKAKATDKVTLLLGAAPGVGNTTTFTVTIHRNAPPPEPEPES